jgi:hypothetical protein
MCCNLVTSFQKTNPDDAGYLSFEQKRGDSNRDYGRRRVKLGNAKTWLERIGETIDVYWGLRFRHDCSIGD